MIKFFKKYCRIVKIDVLVYQVSNVQNLSFSNPFIIQKEKFSNKKKCYFIVDNGKTIHNSYLFFKVHLLKLIKKRGPVIGDCYTNSDYRGKSIYPFVINSIANEILNENNFSEVFIIVNSNNESSIKGIEKAEFVLYSKILTKRFLFFYYDTHITNFNL